MPTPTPPAVQHLTALIRANLGLRSPQTRLPHGDTAWNALARLVGYGDVEWLPDTVATAMYGIDWARRTGRLPTPTAQAIRALSDWQLCALVAEVAVACPAIGVVPRFLITRYPPPQT